MKPLAVNSQFRGIKSLFAGHEFAVPVAPGICGQRAGIAAQIDAMARPDVQKSANCLLFSLFAGNPRICTALLIAALPIAAPAALAAPVVAAAAEYPERASWPCLSRPSTSSLAANQIKTWMAGTSPAMTTPPYLIRSNMLT
jgi:hypothetical protein